MLGWVSLLVAALVLFSTRKRPLAPLPLPSPEFSTPYALWLPEGGEPPLLSPAPAVVGRGAVCPPGPEWILVIGRDIRCPPELPARLAAVDAPLVSAFPRPSGSLWSLAQERLCRDFANPLAVNERLRPEAFADERLAWVSRAHLTGEGVLASARALKASGLSVSLLEGGPLVTVTSRLKAGPVLLALTDGQALPRLVLALIPWLFHLLPVAALWSSPVLGGAACLMLGLARALTARRDGFGWGLVAVGPFLELALAIRAASGPWIQAAPWPEVPTEAPALTGSDAVLSRRRWLDQAAVPYLARRTGGSAAVMAQVYRAKPVGRTAFGRALDLLIQASPGARALRHRRHLLVELGRALKPKTVLSVPSGDGGDAAELRAKALTLCDPDPYARALARRACPEAQILDATVETGPAGPFDLILYVGLTEYLDDEAVIAHLTALLGRLKPGGALLTSATADYPDRARLAKWLGWHTRARSPEHFEALLYAAGLGVVERRADGWGIQQVFCCQALKSPANGGDALGIA